MEKEWEKFRDMVMECTNDVCGMRRVGGQRREGSEWWNVWRWPKREELLRNGFREEIVTYGRCRAQRVAVKLAVQAAKIMATDDGESDWGMISRVTKRCFGKS